MRTQMGNQSNRNMKKHRIWDIVNNNPRANRRHIDWKENGEEEKFNNDNMLYAENTKSTILIELTYTIPFETCIYLPAKKSPKYFCSAEFCPSTN